MIGYNTIDEDGAKVLGKALSKNHTLTYLSMRIVMPRLRDSTSWEQPRRGGCGGVRSRAEAEQDDWNYSNG